MFTADDRATMRDAIAAAAAVRVAAHPNPWVGCVVVTSGGHRHVGATEPPGGPHAEAVALRSAGEAARGGTAYVTLEPCSHQGRTPPCADALVASGVSRVVVGLQDPDPRVSGEGIDRLRTAGIEVEVGCEEEAIREQLLPYLHHRTTGRPYVVLKLAATLDGRTAAPDGTSKWITSEDARRDAHRLRAESDVVIVGSGTVRADDPSLTVRLVEGPDPARVVLGSAPLGAAVHPCREHRGDIGELLDRLGCEGHVQVLVEGGATVAGSFHRAGLVDRYVLYQAPALMGGDAPGLFAGAGAATIESVWRGEILAVARLGPDLRIDFGPRRT